MRRHSAGCIPGLAQTFRFRNMHDEVPVPGDILRVRSTGSCYVIEDWRPGREPGRWIADVVGLGVDAAAEDDPGVWMMG